MLLGRYIQSIHGLYAQHNTAFSTWRDATFALTDYIVNLNETEEVEKGTLVNS